MKNAYLHVKNTKQKYLKKYIFYSATKIQSLIRGFLARRVKVPIKRKISGNASKIEGVALVWKTRRIMRLKEVKNRIQQITDYENAEVEAHTDAKKTKNTEERQKLLNMIEGFRTSRANTVEKLIVLIRKMNQNGLWMTYKTSQMAEESLRTPRGIMAALKSAEPLRQKAFTSSSIKHHYKHDLTQVQKPGQRLDTETVSKFGTNKVFNVDTKKRLDTEEADLLEIPSGQ